MLRSSEPMGGDALDYGQVYSYANSTTCGAACRHWTESEIERRVVEEEAAVCPAPWQSSCRTARRQQYPTT